MNELDLDLKRRVNIQGPKIELPDDINLDQLTLPTLDSQVDFNFSQAVSDSKLGKTESLFYGFDLPMTITNTDWYWSPDSFNHPSVEVRALQRSIMNSTLESNEPAAADLKSKYENRIHSFGNYSIIDNVNLNHANILKNLDIHVNNPNIPCTSDLQAGGSGKQNNPLSSLNLEFELHKAKIRLDTPSCTSGQVQQIHVTPSTSGGPTKITRQIVANVHNPPGDLNHPNIELIKSSEFRIKSGSATTKTKKTETTLLFKRAPSSASSVTHLDKHVSHQPQVFFKLKFKILVLIFGYVRPRLVDQSRLILV